MHRHGNDPGNTNTFVMKEPVVSASKSSICSQSKTDGNGDMEATKRVSNVFTPLSSACEGSPDAGSTDYFFRFLTN